MADADMDFISVQVELPQYHHSFSVQVIPSGTVLDIKREVALVCPGNPNVEGQRLIWRGRFLSDAEKVEDLWTTPDAVRIVHLAVNPDAWSGSPPEFTNVNLEAPLPDIPVIAVTPPPLEPVDNPGLGYPEHALPPREAPARNNITPTTTIRLRIAGLDPSVAALGRSRPAPIWYTVYLHNNALRAIQRKPFLAPLSETEKAAGRLEAYAVMEFNGITWPDIFDKEYPPETEEEGAKYETTNIDGYPYLRLLTPDAGPTARQLHAVQVLKYTFPVLALPFPLTNTPRSQNTGQRAQQPPNQNRFANIPVIVAEFLTPLIFLGIRTVFFLYFFTPARKPFILVVLGLWVAYECWNTIRRAFREINLQLQGAPPPPLHGQGRRRAAAGNANGGGGGGGGRAQGGNGLRQGRPVAERSTGDLLISQLARLNLDTESEAVNHPERVPREPPSFFTRARVFISLLLLTLHPAVWNRRRALLKQREGQLRMERHARNAANNPGENAENNERIAEAAAVIAERQARRPNWVIDYVARIGLAENIPEDE